MSGSISACCQWYNCGRDTCVNTNGVSVVSQCNDFKNHAGPHQRQNIGTAGLHGCWYLSGEDSCIIVLEHNSTSAMNAHQAQFRRHLSDERRGVGAYTQRL